MTRTPYTQDMANHLLPGQGDLQTTLLARDADYCTQMDLLAGTSPGYEVVTTGALTVGTAISALSISGTKAFSLADGTYNGQRKTILCTIAGSTPAGTLTIATPSAVTGAVCSATFFFDTVGQEVNLLWNGSAWLATTIKRAGGVADNVVVGTTVLTSKNLWKRYCLSVTATVSSTGTKALPDGSAVGERCFIINTTAASTPVGSIDGTYTSGLAAAYTHMGAIGVVASATAVGDGCMLEWNGTSWDVAAQSGLTFS